MPCCCSICYERFAAPVALPCGHIFCRECLRNTVDAIKSPSIQHFCPACRAPYSIVSLDPALVPPYLRPHILPPIRPVFFDDAVSPVSKSPQESEAHPADSQSQSQTQPESHSPSHTTSTSPLPATPSPVPSLPHTPPGPSLPSPPAADADADAHPSPSSAPHPHPHPPTLAALRRTAAEADALRLACQTWRRRAEVHAAANAGLLAFGRAARAAALRMRAERDDARRRAEVLQRQMRALEAMLRVEVHDSSNINPDLNTPAPAVPVKRGLPAFVAQQQRSQSAKEELKAALAARDAQPSLLGPPLKRRRLAMGSGCDDSQAQAPFVGAGGVQVVVQ